MTTNNRTNGQIVAKALVAHCEDHKMPVPRGSVKKIVEALRVAGRLAGEPTEAQVEAATQSLLEGADLQVFDVRRQEELRLRVRAALVAAQGAAPAQPSNGADEDMLATVRAERDAALARIAEAAKLHRPTLPRFGPKSCVHDGRAWPCPTAVSLGLNEGEHEDE